MRQQDRAVFSAAAKHFQVWILVRRTNPAALLYIARPGYYPKPIDCKAKTADRDLGRYRLAGLVADPTQHPAAFDPVKLSGAVALWDTFVMKLGGPLFGYGKGDRPGQTGRRGYNLDTNPRSAHFGCLTLHRLYLHGDYDLYDVIDPENPLNNEAIEEMLHGERNMCSPLQKKVQDWINARIGVPVVQHGGEMQFADHSEQTVDGFLPRGDLFTAETKRGIREIYQIALEGRQPLGKKG
jgi:hypothetical protein